MEAASLVSSLLNFTGSKLASKIVNEFKSTLGVNENLQQLSDTVEEIKYFLQNAGDKVINDPAFNWMNELKEIAYDIDDLISDCHMEAEKLKAFEINSEKHVMVKCFCDRPKLIRFQYKVANKIKIIRKRFEAIITKRMDMNALKGCVPLYPIHDKKGVTTELPSLTIVDEATVVGRDNDKSAIIYELTKRNHPEVKLTNGNNEGMILAVSIVGLGGSGKTTLAKLVFNDGNEIKKHFEIRLWVSVSEEFDVAKLIGKLYEAITDQKYESHPLQSMSRIISEKLRGKRFLLVLDDVWNSDVLFWEPFMLHLKAGAAGSRILVTTRSQEVAKILKSTISYNLPALSEDDSWKLFLQSTESVKEDWDTEFTETGKDIVRKCRGVPLAVKSLGGMVSSMKEISSWQAVRDSELWHIEDRVLTSLQLSYFHLPAHLQQCFLHCSIFPKGYSIDKDQLIVQWIAHGLIIPMNELEELEHVGNNYFDSLLKISFLQDLVEDKYNAIVTCKMHDLVHGLARRILGGKILTTPVVINDTRQSCRYLALTQCIKKIDRKLIKKARALYVSDGTFIFNKPIKKADYVRTVILEHIYTVSLPPERVILKFQFHGYLRISDLQCEALPEAISCCWNLQALHVINCRELLSLPKSIGKLRKLRSLDLSGAWKLESLPQSIGDCDNLHSLRLISCANIRILPLDLFRMPGNLRNINLSACSRIRILPNSIVQLKMLNSLNLSFCSDLEDLPSSCNWATLCSLKLSCSKLTKLPDSIVNFYRLKELDLNGCHELCGMPLGIGQLTQLRRLGLFFVGDGREYASMSEISSLNMLIGDLEIRNIRYTEGSSNDRGKACLSEKSNVHELTLKWQSRKHVTDIEQELDVLNKLQPPPGIKKLNIHGYPGQRFSHWMLKQEIDSSGSFEGIVKQLGTPCFPHLTQMLLLNFPNLKDLSGLVSLPSLNTLELINLSAVETIGGGPFPLLKELHIQKMPHLSECSTMVTVTLSCREDAISDYQALQCFPSLRVLEIIRCPKLLVKPSFPSSLESLIMESSSMELLDTPSSCDHHEAAATFPSSSCEGANLTSLPLLKVLNLRAMMASSSSRWNLLEELVGLQSLEISSCDDLVELPQSMQKLTSLQQLKIWNCASLQILPGWIGEFSSLGRMDIRGCAMLSSLPPSMVQLNSLQYLTIGNCDALQLPEWMGDLSPLRSLDIWGLPKLISLPPSLQHLTSLQELKLSCLSDLLMLPEWLGELSALRHLKIETCPSLASLPSSIKRLTSLQELEIIRCRKLRQRYRKGEGEDWHLICHIPHVDIWKITDED